MSRTNAAETDYLELLFQNLAWPNIGDAAGLPPSVAAGSFFISLHTADPGETGNQSTSEATFGGYARQAVARSGAGWTIAANAVSNTAAITFPEATSGPQTITHVGIGTALSGAGNLIWSGAISPSRIVDTGVTLQFAAGALDIVPD